MRKLLPLLTLVLSFQLLSAQGFLKKLGENKAVGNILEGKPPVSTSYKDVDLKNTLPPEFGERETYTTLSSLPRNEDGTYTLAPGYYQTFNLSYCLKAGTNGPARGDAYGNAPILGRMSDIVEAILVKSQELWRNRASGAGNGLATHLSAAFVSQKDVQLLLWAIIARADFEDMQNKTKAVALALLSPEQVVKLNGGAVKTVVNFASEKGWMEKPEWMRKMEEAEQSLRQLYKSSTSSYEDFERLAVLAGMLNEPQIATAGTWFRHKEGFYVRFEPQGYQRTHLKFYVPQGKGVKLRITGIIATPSDSRQRLAQTDMPVEEYERIGKTD